MSTTDEVKSALGVGDDIRERALPERRGLHTGEPAYKQFSDEMIGLIGKTIMPERYQMSELYQVLELAATYKLDPFTRELWAVRYSRNADAAVQVVVGRDGLLAIAERHSDFLGFRNEAVYENDEFEILEAQSDWKLPTLDGTKTVPTQVRFKAGHPTQRGGLIGAFAEVYRAGRAATFFWAPLEDYDRASTTDKSPWVKMKGVMIEKVALVTALRHAYRVSGLYIIEEMSGMMVDERGKPQTTADDEPFYGDDEQVAEHLRLLFDALGAKYLPAKRRLMLTDLDDRGRLEMVERLQAECEAAGIPLPDPPGPLTGEVVGDGEDVDWPDEPPPPAGAQTTID